jgi:hypothetical protein
VFVGFVVGRVVPLVTVGAEGLNEAAEGTSSKSRSVSAVFRRHRGSQIRLDPIVVLRRRFPITRNRPPDPPKLSNSTHTSLFASLNPIFERILGFSGGGGFSKANLAASIIFFDPFATAVDPEKRSLNTSPSSSTLSRSSVFRTLNPQRGGRGSSRGGCTTRSGETTGASG